MGIHKIIVRFDIDPAYEVIDQPGKILRIMDNHLSGENFKAGETVNTREVEAHVVNETPAYSQTLSMKPNTCIIAITTHEGVSLENLASYDVLTKSLKVVTEIFEEFSIKNIIRAGFRVNYFSKLSSPEDIQEVFRGLILNEIVDVVQDDAGPINDYGLAFDGGEEKGIQYHVRIGPTSLEENGKYFPSEDNFTKPELDCDFVADIDFFASQFELADSKPRYWVTNCANSISGLVSKLENIVISQLEKRG